MQLKSLLILPLLLLAANDSYAQLSAEADSSKTENRLFGLPLVFYTPETSWGFGAAGIYTFRFEDQPRKVRASQVQLGFAYTLNKQVLAYLPYQIYFGDLDYSLYGEFGYYIYNYNFYGVGNSNPEDYQEVYGVNYPRLRANFLKKIGKACFIGLRYWYEDFEITEIEEGGQLSTPGLVEGRKGGVTSGPGIVFNYDTRNSYFYPSNGWFVEAVVHNNSGTFGSDFNFNRFRLDASTYFSLPVKTVLALNFFGDFTYGSTPFNQMGLLGGTRKQRGYYEGRFRDKQLLLFQSELRASLYKRFGMVGFFSCGAVAHETSAFRSNNIQLAGGLGLRYMINTDELINVRLDMGIGIDGPAYYLTIGEAF